ncbi:energy transducer TonB [Luteimonas sp. Sa2BVA3]|uniref:Energy transducer TonB n=1 Tax=Luteimonas colneyensis TaxID=2762230 RepID=A0ABR8UJL2_9GAMM|nr:energy transducer TonB [Luteimonas colneyensis]MBD7988207.1 energy transducer TonB [Luteimonas colneyensis]
MRRYTMAAALATVLLASACQPDAPPASGAVRDDAAAVDGAGTDAAQGHAQGPDSRESVAQLDQAAARALREGRLYAPEGDSAIEHWLQARRLDPANAAVNAAIVGLQPYLLIGCEQAIARHDFAEAHRLHALVAASDPAAPALPRLAAAIASAEAESGRAEATRLAAEEAQRQRDEAEARAEEMARTATARVAAAQAASSAAQPSSPPPSQPSPPPSTPVAAQASAADAQSPQTPASPVPRLLHQPPPRYPSLALSRKMEGSVQVAFTILADGAVGDTRVIGADPPGVFDRSALAAVGGYRFEPPGRSMPSVVTVRFSLGG